MSGLVELEQDRWRDTVTGLVVVQAPTMPLYRVFKGKHGALNPKLLEPERATWSRFDVLDHATIYGSETEDGAFCEVLGHFRPATLDLASIFADLGPGQDPVAEEWASYGHMQQRQLARVWRVERNITSFTGSRRDVTTAIAAGHIHAGEPQDIPEMHPALRSAAAKLGLRTF